MSITAEAIAQARELRLAKRATRTTRKGYARTGYVRRFGK